MKKSCPNCGSPMLLTSCPRCKEEFWRCQQCGLQTVVPMRFDDNDVQRRLQMLEEGLKSLHEHVMKMWPFIQSLIAATGVKQDLYDRSVQHLKELIAMSKE